MCSTCRAIFNFHFESPINSILWFSIRYYFCSLREFDVIIELLTFFIAICESNQFCFYSRSGRHFVRVIFIIRPKIVTQDGNLVFVSASAHNITFRSSSDSYINVNGDNLLSIVQLVSAARVSYLCYFWRDVTSCNIICTRYRYVWRHITWQCSSFVRVCCEYIYDDYDVMASAKLMIIWVSCEQFRHLSCDVTSVRAVAR